MNESRNGKKVVIAFINKQHRDSSKMPFECNENVTIHPLKGRESIEEIIEMKPDIVVRRKSDGVSFVLDTKWKILDAGKVNYGITQADMYQMFAYQKKYGAERVILLYPETEKISLEDNIEFRSDDDVVVRVQFIDLFNVTNSITEVIQQFDVIAV